MLLFLHGGGFRLGSLRSHGELAARLGRASGMRVLFPEYRLAPEHPFLRSRANDRGGAPRLIGGPPPLLSCRDVRSAASVTRTGDEQLRGEAAQIVAEATSRLNGLLAADR